MHYSTNDRCWPYSDSGAANLSVSFGEIARLFWGKFLNLGFSSIHRQLFLKSGPPKFIDQGLLPTQSGLWIK